MLSMTKKSGYGLIAMCHLAELGSTRRASAREIANAHGVPVSLLMNVMKQLCSAGYVGSVRGSRGGYFLAVQPEEVDLIGVMEALEGPVKLAECVSGAHDDSSGDTCSLLPKCPIAGPMHRVHRRIRDMLKELTLQDILPPHVVRRAEASA